MTTGAISCGGRLFAGEKAISGRLPMWQRAVKIAPLDHVGGFNFLLCRRTLEPQQGYMRESLDLAKKAVLLPYWNGTLLIAVLCSYETGEVTVSANLTVMLAEKVRGSSQAQNDRFFDRFALRRGLAAHAGGANGARMKLLLALALPIFALDQATKWWIVNRLSLSHEWPPIDPNAHMALVPGWFHFVYWANTGAAFSSFHNNNGAFIVIGIVALAGIVVATLRNVFPDRASKIGVGLLVGGILGNVTDRFIHGHVVDFLLFDLHVRFADPWPAFNVADSAICIAVGVFILASFLAPKTVPEPV